MTQHKCDFCQGQIAASANRLSSIISYLPCFHAICQNCKAQRLNGQNTLVCAVCNIRQYPYEIYDLVLPDTSKLHCMSCIGSSRNQVEFYCQTCNGQFLCSRCVTEHRNARHLIVPAVLDTPARSQCTTHPNATIVALCSCNARLCELCYREAEYQPTVSVHGAHQRKLLSELSNSARVSLTDLMQTTRRDAVALTKVGQTIATSQRNTREMACRARTTVASEIVELCNALIRRGNDIVTAIDSAEKAKLGALAKAEGDVKFVADKLTKIEYFVDMALQGVTKDPPSTVSAKIFADKAYTLFDEKRGQVLPSVEHAVQHLNSVQYVSDLHPVLNSINSFGQLNLDGTIRIPPVTTPPSARMFSVTSNGVMGGGLCRQSNSSATSPAAIAANGLLRSANAASINQSKQQQDGGLIPLLHPPLPPVSRVIQNAPHSKQCNVSLNVTTMTTTPNDVSSTLSHSSSHRIQQFPTQMRAPAISQQQHAAPQQQPSAPTHPSMAGGFSLMQSQQQTQPNLMAMRAAAQHQQQHARQQQHQSMPSSSAAMMSPCSSQMPSSPTVVPSGAGSMRPPQATAMNDTVLHQRGSVGGHPPVTAGTSSMLHTAASRQQQMTAMIMASAIAGRRPAFPPQHGGRSIFSLSGALPPTSGGEPLTAAAVADRVGVGGAIATSLLSTTVASLLPTETTGSASVESNAVNNNPVLTSHLLNNVSKPLSVASSLSPSLITFTTAARPEEVRPQPRIRIFERPLPDLENIAPADDDDELVDSVVIDDGSPNGKEAVDGNDMNGIAGIQNEDDMNDLMELIAGHEKNEQLNGSSKRAASVDEFSTTAAKRACVAAVINGSEPVTTDMEVRKKKGAEDTAKKRETEVIVTPRGNHGIQAKEPSSGSTPPPCVLVDGNAKALLCLDELTSPPLKTGDNAGVKSVSDNSGIASADSRNGHGGAVGSGMMVGQPPSTKLILKRRGDIIYPASMDESDLKPDMLTLKMKLSDGKQSLTGFTKKRHKNKSGGKTKSHHRSGKGGSKSSLTRGKGRNSRSPMPSTMFLMSSSSEGAVDVHTSGDTEIATSSDSSLRKAPEKMFGDGVDDEWDDYCFYCNQGCDDETGELGCCATCPHVFHNQCHVPKIHVPMGDLPDDWKCSSCVQCEPLKIHSSAFGEREQLLCAKTLLACFTNSTDVEPFLHPIGLDLVMYHNIIKESICFDDIAARISKRTYKTVTEFLDDMNLLFINCSTFNVSQSLIAKQGREVYACYRDAVKRFLPYFTNDVWIYVSLRNDEGCINSTMVKKALSKRTSRSHEAGTGGGADPNSSSTTPRQEAVVGESCPTTQSRHHQQSGSKEDHDKNNSGKRNGDVESGNDANSAAQ